MDRDSGYLLYTGISLGALGVIRIPEISVEVAHEAGAVELIARVAAHQLGLAMVW